MKKVILICFVLFTSFSNFAQQIKNDVILKLNGEELTGKVLKITDESIEFTYTNESVVYTIKKADVMKITFGSGRIEVYNKTTQPPEGQSQQSPATGVPNKPGTQSPEDHHNKVAILPFSYLKDGQPTADAAAERIQIECYSTLSKHAGVYTVANPRTTNALLAKAGVNKENIKTYTMGDICNILGVEYLVDCMISVDKGDQSTVQSTSGEVKQKNQKSEKDAQINTSSSSTTTQNYKTNLVLSIYNDKGNSIYSQNRNSFLSTEGAYKNTLEYLLKRCPLYTK